MTSPASCPPLTGANVLDALRERARAKAARAPALGAAAISPSVKTAEGGKERGTDGGKKVKERKRHALVDTLGLLIAVAVTAANGRAAQEVFAQARGRDFPRLGVVYADSRYHNCEQYDCLRIHRRPYRVEVVSRRRGRSCSCP